jgi:hypothetical protein
VLQAVHAASVIEPALTFTRVGDGLLTLGFDGASLALQNADPSVGAISTDT